MEQNVARDKAKALLNDYLEMNNHRKTPERYAILDAIASMDEQFSLDQLMEKLTGELRFPVSRATLYNTMNLFVKLRIVFRHRLASKTTYEFCQFEGGNIHQVCSNCGKLVLLQSSEVEDAIEKMRLKRFKRDGFAVYIYGICSTCQAKITRKKNNEK